MKTNRAFLFTLATLLCAAAPGWGQTAPFAQTPAIQPRPVPSQPVAVPWHPTEREAHQTTWESISVEEINPITHQRVPRRQRYVEIATGLNRLNRQGQFEAAHPEFALQDGGAVAEGGAHSVRLPADIATDYGVVVTTPAGLDAQEPPQFLGVF